jgi:WW domain-containing oxidoreductase
MSLVGLLKGTGGHGFGYDTTAEQVTDGLDLSGRRILITGCNSGIGLESARVLSLRGATVLGAARTREKAAAAMADFATPAVALECELSDPSSVRACVAEARTHGQLDAIVANAGIMALPKRSEKYGVELQLFTNHIGHFILVTGLVDRLAENGRAVVVSSRAHRRAPRQGIRLDDLAFERDYSGFRAYGQSKLANLLFARALARRFDGSGRVAIAVHPGVIATNLGRNMNPILRGGFAAIGPFLKNEAQGAATQVFAAVHPAAAAYNGEYLADCQPARSTPIARDAELGERLWRVSEELIASL